MEENNLKNEVDKIKVKIRSEFKIPEMQHKDDSGYDLFAIETKLIKAKSFDIVKTGIFLEIPNGYEAQIRPRSGLAAKYGISILNTPGTIDAGYRGEVKVILFNFSDEDFLIQKGMRIAQLVFNKIVNVDFVVVNKSEQLSPTKRNINGFGSTGH